MQESIRKSIINLPAIAQTVRTYARFIDDDDEDFPSTKSRVERRDRPSPFADRRSFGERKSFGGRFNNQGNSFNRFNDGPPRFQRSGNESFNDGIQKLRPIHFNAEELKEIKKDFYQPSEITKNRTEAEIAAFRTKNEITVPEDAPKPIFTFNELEHLPPNLAKEIHSREFVECTSIQAQGMPIALSGRNLVGIAQTG